MADTKISALTAATAMADANEFAINEAGASKKLTGTLIKAWQGNILRNVNTSDVTISAGATTYCTGSNIAVPTGKLRAGTWFRWSLIGTKTAAGTATRNLLIKVGTNGSTADATIVTLTSSTPTAAVDTGTWQVTFVIRTIGASATSHGAYAGWHQLSTTGLFANETEVIQAAGSTFDSTTANLIVGLAITTGASEVITLQQVIAEAFNL
jgi:hypothetical protein